MGSYLKNDQDAKRAMARNKPRIVFPILNTLFGLAFLGLYIYLLVVTDLTLWSMAIVLPILGMFIFSAWYLGFFSKKKNQKKIYNFQEETQLLLAYAKSLTKYRCYDVPTTKHFNFYKVSDEMYNRDIPKFNIESRCFETEVSGDVQMHFGVTCCGLAIDYETKNLLGVYGMAPCSVWLKRKLKVPTSTKATIRADFDSYKANKQTIFKYLRNSDTFYDSKSGWLCIGDRKLNSLTTTYEIAPDTLVSIYDNDIIAMWVKIESKLSID